jgi:glycine/D-amino acid oxidase-like deaminating enzyme
MCTHGITIGVAEARKRYGQQRARELYDTFREAVDVVEELTLKERIDCDFHRAGRLGVVWKAKHLEAMRATQRDLAETSATRPQSSAGASCAPNWARTTTTVPSSTPSAPPCTSASTSTAWPTPPNAPAPSSTNATPRLA